MNCMFWLLVIVLGYWGAFVHRRRPGGTLVGFVVPVAASMACATFLFACLLYALPHTDRLLWHLLFCCAMLAALLCGHISITFLKHMRERPTGEAVLNGAFVAGMLSSAGVVFIVLVLFAASVDSDDPGGVLLFAGVVAVGLTGIVTALVLRLPDHPDIRMLRAGIRALGLISPPFLVGFAVLVIHTTILDPILYQQQRTYPRFFFGTSEHFKWYTGYPLPASARILLVEEERNHILGDGRYAIIFDASPEDVQRMTSTCPWPNNAWQRGPVDLKQEGYHPLGWAPTMNGAPIPWDSTRVLYLAEPATLGWYRGGGRVLVIDEARGRVAFCDQRL